MTASCPTPAQAAAASIRSRREAAAYLEREAHRLLALAHSHGLDRDPDDCAFSCLQLRIRAEAASRRDGGAR